MTSPITDDYTVLGDINLWATLCSCLSPKQDPLDPDLTLTELNSFTDEPIRVLRYIDGEVRSYNPPSEIPS